MLDRADPQHTCLADLAAGLVPVGCAKLAAAQDDEAVVAQVGEVRHQHFD